MLINCFVVVLGSEQDVSISDNQNDREQTGDASVTNTQGNKLFELL